MQCRNKYLLGSSEVRKQSRLYHKLVTIVWSSTSKSFESSSSIIILQYFTSGLTVMPCQLSQSYLHWRRAQETNKEIDIEFSCISTQSTLSYCCQASIKTNPFQIKLILFKVIFQANPFQATGHHFQTHQSVQTHIYWWYFTWFTQLFLLSVLFIVSLVCCATKSYNGLFKITNCKI